MNYGQAQAQGIPYKAWLYMCEQEDIQCEQEEEEEEQDFFTALADPVSREIFPGEDPDSICMCPACSAMRAKYEHDIALARAAPHCPETPTEEESHLVSDALNTPLARWIQGQLAMERQMS